MDKHEHRKDKIKKIINKLAWFLSIVAGVLTKPRGDWLDFLFGLFGAVMAIYLISLLFAWLLSLITDEEKRQEKRKVYLSWLMILVSTLIIIGNINTHEIPWESSTVETDKNPEFSEQTGNLYKNTKYGFRIEFPEGWKVEPGDGSNILQKAIGKDQGLIVGVRDLSGTSKDDWTINDLTTLEEFEKEQIEAVRSKYPEVAIISSGETKIDNIPAYWIKSSVPYSIYDEVVEGVNLHYQVLYKNMLYFINASATADKFDATEPEFKKSIATFAFED